MRNVSVLVIFCCMLFLKPINILGQSGHFLTYAISEYKFYAGNIYKSKPSLNFFQSYQFTLGGDVEYIFAKKNGVGLGLNYVRNKYSIRQSPDKHFPDDFLHESEDVITDGLATELFLSFYLTEQTETGLYLKFAYVYDNVLGRKHRFTDKSPAGAVYSYAQTKLYDVPFLAEQTQSVKIILGFKELAVSAQYRITPALSKTYLNQIPSDLPKLSVGISLGLLFLDL